MLSTHRMLCENKHANKPKKKKKKRGILLRFFLWTNYKYRDMVLSGEHFKCKLAKVFTVLRIHIHTCSNNKTERRAKTTHELLLLLNVNYVQGVFKHRKYTCDVVFSSFFSPLFFSVVFICFSFYGLSLLTRFFLLCFHCKRV